MYYDDYRWIKKWALICGILLVIAVYLPIIVSGNGLTEFYGIWTLLDLSQIQGKQKTMVIAIMVLAVIPFLFYVTTKGRILALLLMVFGVVTWPLLAIVNGAAPTYTLLAFLPLWTVALIGAGNGLGSRFPEHRLPKILILLGSIAFLAAFSIELFSKNSLGDRYVNMLLKPDLWKDPALAMALGAFCLLIFFHIVALIRSFVSALAGFTKILWILIAILFPILLIVATYLKTKGIIPPVPGAVILPYSLAVLKAFSLIYVVILLISAGLFAAISISIESRGIEDEDMPVLNI